MERRALRACLAAGAVLLELGCGSSRTCPTVFYSGPIDVPATDMVVTNDFRVSAQYAGSGIEVSIVDNAGTLTVEGDGPLPAFVYARTPQPLIQSTVFGGLAVKDGVWYPFWLYCGVSGGLVSLAWERTSDTQMRLQFASGPCSDDTSQYVYTHLQWPAHQLNDVALTCGFSAIDETPPVPQNDRPWLVLGDGVPGSYYSYANDTSDWWTILPFSTVDCRWGGCGAQGRWYEIHSIVWHSPSGLAASADNVAFTIFYFPVDGSTPGIYQDYGFLLPAAGPFGRQNFPDATWTISP